MTVPETIKILMNKKNWSEKQLARKAHLSEITISDILNHNLPPSLPILIQIIDAFNIPFNEFINFSGTFPFLTSDQAEFIENWRNLSADNQKEIWLRMCSMLGKQDKSSD